MNGIGNDFVLLNAMEGLPQTDLSALARRLCDRESGFGADGLILAVPAAGDADFRMRFYNADGSEAELCGNGARCLARFGYMCGLSDTHPRFETAAGTVTAERIGESVYRIALAPPALVELDRRVDLPERSLLTDYLLVGVPHALLPVAGLRNLSTDDLRPLAKALRFAPEYPAGANVNFFEQTGKDEIFLRTFERGVEDFTLACGTGAASAVSALTLRGVLSGKGCRVTSAGGTLTVDAERTGDRITALSLTGETCIEYTGDTDI